jgi:hypothetical protein
LISDGILIAFELVLKSGNAVYILSFFIHWTNQYQQKHCSKLVFSYYRGFIFLNLVTDSNLLSHDWALHRDAGSYDLDFKSTKKSGKNFKTVDDMIEIYSQLCSGIHELWFGIIFLFFSSYFSFMKHINTSSLISSLHFCTR